MTVMRLQQQVFISIICLYRGQVSQFNSLHQQVFVGIVCLFSSDFCRERCLHQQVFIGIIFHAEGYYSLLQQVFIDIIFQGKEVLLACISRYLSVSFTLGGIYM